MNIQFGKLYKDVMNFKYRTENSSTTTEQLLLDKSHDENKERLYLSTFNSIFFQLAAEYGDSEKAKNHIKEISDKIFILYQESKSEKGKLMIFILDVLDQQDDGFIVPNQSAFNNIEPHELSDAIYSLIDMGILQRRDCEGLAFEYVS